MSERWEAPLCDGIAIIRQVRLDKEGWQAAVNDLTRQCLDGGLVAAGYDAEDLVQALATISRVLVAQVAAKSDSTEDGVLDVLYAVIVDLLARRMDEPKER